MIRKWLCKLGFHAWIYTEDKRHRACLYCPVAQYQVIQDPGSFFEEEWENEVKDAN